MTVRRTTKAWFNSLDKALPLTVQTVEKRTLWADVPDDVKSGTIADRCYWPTELRFVAESRDGRTPVGERPLIVCRNEIHSHMVGLVTWHKGKVWVFCVAKTEAGYAMSRNLHGSSASDPYSGCWSLTCAYQYSRVLNQINALSWLVGPSDPYLYGCKMLASCIVNADGGMMAKRYRLALVYLPYSKMSAVSAEAKQSIGPVARWLTWDEIQHAAECKRVSEFVFTTLGLLAGRSLEEVANSK